MIRDENRVTLHVSAARRWVIAILALTLTFILVSITALILIHQNTSPLDIDISAAQRSMPFPVFKLDYVPSGYSYIPGSISAHNQVVLFSVATKDKRTITISEQAKTSGYDFDQLSGTDEFNTPYGKAYVEDFELRTTGSLVSNKTWVIINTQQPIGQEEMKRLLNSLVPLAAQQ